jgi:hypothetical protein
MIGFRDHCCYHRRCHCSPDCRDGPDALCRVATAVASEEAAPSGSAAYQMLTTETENAEYCGCKDKKLGGEGQRATPRISRYTASRSDSARAMESALGPLLLVNRSLLRQSGLHRLRRSSAVAGVTQRLSSWWLVRPPAALKMAPFTSLCYARVNRNADVITSN